MAFFDFFFGRKKSLQGPHTVQRIVANFVDEEKSLITMGDLKKRAEKM